MAFRGQSAHNIDAKGRLSIPARFRDLLKGKYNNELILIRFPDHLAIFPLEEWSKTEEKLANVVLYPKELIDFKRAIYANTIDCSLDAQGRILIPANIRKKTNLEKEVIVLGMGHYLEIWNKGTFEKRMDSVEENFYDLSHDIANEYGITI